MNGTPGLFTKYYGPLKQRYLDLSILKDYHIDQFTGEVSTTDYDMKFITELKGQYKKAEIVYMGQDNTDRFICCSKN